MVRAVDVLPITRSTRKTANIGHSAVWQSRKQYRRPGKGRMKRRLLLLRALPCLNQLRSERRVLSLKLLRHDDQVVG